MQSSQILDKIRECVINFDRENVKRHCEEALNAGIEPFDIIGKGLSKGLDVVGEKYDNGEFFLSELILAGAVTKSALEVLEPYLKKKTVQLIGRIVIGTVKGDLHDIGKNIVAMMLVGSGFEVYDLGVDVSAERFVEEALKRRASILGVSALLSTTLPYMRVVVDALKNVGLRERIKVIIGGAATSEKALRDIGADAYAENAASGLKTCKNWVKP